MHIRHTHTAPLATFCAHSPPPLPTSAPPLAPPPIPPAPPALVQSHGYPLEEHFVTTEDGYILRVFRVKHGRTPPTPTEQQRQQRQHRAAAAATDAAGQYQAAAAHAAGQHEVAAAAAAAAGTAAGQHQTAAAGVNAVVQKIQITQPGAGGQRGRAGLPAGAGVDSAAASTATAGDGDGAPAQASAAAGDGDGDGTAAAGATVVHLQHGLLGSSSDWALNGPGFSLVFLLAGMGVGGRGRGRTGEGEWGSRGPEEEWDGPTLGGEGAEGRCGSTPCIDDALIAHSRLLDRPLTAH